MQKPKNSLGIVQDDRGRILGKIVSRSDMLAEDIKTVKNFLLEIQKTRLGEDMAKQNSTVPEKCNLVWLAGTIKSLKVRDDGGAFMLLDPGGETKWIPCTIHNNSELSKLLGRFKSDDEIKIHGFVRAWSQKKDDETWENKAEVRITAIKSAAPARSPVGRSAGDDDIPF